MAKYAYFGVYMVKNEKMRVVFLGLSGDVRGWVRKTYSMLKLGKRVKIVEEMGGKYEVEIKVLERCEKEEGYARQGALAKEFIFKGYTVRGMEFMDKIVEIDEWEPGTRLKDIAVKFKLQDKSVMVWLDRLEAGIEQEVGGYAHYG